MSPPPCLYDTVIQSLFNWKAVQLKGRPISWAVLHHWKSMGQILVPSCPPGVQLLPHFEVWSYRACQPLQMWPISHFCEIHSLSYEESNFFRNVKSMEQLWDAPAPRGATLPHFEVWSYRACQPLQMWQISNFCEIHSLSYEASKFFAMLSQCVWFCPYFAPGANIVPPIAYKSHSTRFPIRPHVLTPHSWLCDKTVGGVARRNKSGRRRK